MNLELGYSSDSENENINTGNVDFNANIDATAIVLSHQLATGTSNDTKKTLSGQIQHEFMDESQYLKNKRLFSNIDVGGNIPEYQKMSLYESNKATNAKNKDFKKKHKKSRGGFDSFDVDIDAYSGSWENQSEQAGTAENLLEDSMDGESVPIGNDDLKENINIRESDFVESSKYYGKKGKEAEILELPDSYKVKFATTIAGQKEYFVPKKLLCSFKAHEAAVTSLTFLPKSGHLMLSSGTDGSIKLWSTFQPKKLIRDFKAHRKAVKFAKFSDNGHYFISCSYDKTVKIWNTVTGKMEFKFPLKSNPNMCIFVANEPDEFMVALDNKRVEHYNWKTNELIQVYEHHQSSVTYIEFLNNGTQFITASDDRTLKVWDLRINMPIKYIQDPKQQAMPIIKKHPQGRYFAAQSMDNQILVFSTNANDKFKKNTNKSFQGHNCTAYSIQIAFTPDGRTIASGDSKGYCYFWDWKTTKLIKRLKVSDNVISCIDVHPLETSLIVMAGFDGKIYMYS